mmetsp:Transcript_14878/g.19410  ORF Transcript_14878/g.19410 Transcript_14878/m.19410 type:complete len:225 (-) Transcript_14878:276-950(-)
MKLAIATTLLTAASAFVTPHTGYAAPKTAVVLSMSEEEAAVEEEAAPEPEPEPVVAASACISKEAILAEPNTLEFGSVWDPLNLAETGSDETLAWFRHAEVKHGRVAMAACLGWYITAAGVHPAFDSTLSSDPLEAAKQLPTVGWLQFVLGCGAIEWLAQDIKKRPGYVPGDLLGAAYWVDDSDEGWVDYQNKEINNGRLAMVAIMGIIVQDLLYGNYGDQIFK